jgi:hypothetical protein
VINGVDIRHYSVPELGAARMEMAAMMAARNVVAARSGKPSWDSLLDFPSDRDEVDKLFIRTMRGVISI